MPGRTRDFLLSGHRLEPAGCVFLVYLPASIFMQDLLSHWVQFGLSAMLHMPPAHPDACVDRKARAS